MVGASVEKTLTQHKMGDYRRMDALLQQIEFVDFVSIEIRKKEISEIDRRIAALQDAKASLAKAPVYRFDRSKNKTAREVCSNNGWVEEDAARLVEAFKARPMDANKPTARSVGAIASGMGTLGRAIAMA